ncbi:AlwI family type II restriction endonuclease [Carboxydothermus ferrireducens]|uniref:AlwI restriction endonuclease n=1 Tax=Carboxydothermus ferrireducens DSM 11255 TaxID=1119529 RepID=A0ABX2RAL4_9THEO|nr:AlwI family type II restriction endonuclease [Carboxydothermus ferrireducens]NYE57176.1 hypothetical protein [Carboxydothermus ferrireducens DSM 11255]
MKERKVWFITRPERDPKFHREALLALIEATDGLKIQWQKNREAHINYEKVLIAKGLKRNNISNDGSGGRTWAAMLKTFAYVYTDDNGYLHLTKVGEKIRDGIKVKENIIKQILTLQIPNAYFLEPGFRPKFESGFRIRPARFLIKLTNQKELDYYLTKEEITFFAMTAKNDNELPEITKKILHFRKADDNEKQIIKQEIAEKYDHRERSDKGARDFELAHGDVAHTFMLLCEYTELVEYFRGEALRINPKKSKDVSKEIEYYDERYPFNTRYLISLQRMAQSNGLDVDSYKASKYGKIKPAGNKLKTENKIRQLLANYPSLSELTFSELKSILEKELTSKEAEEYAHSIKEFAPKTLNSDFVESYLNEYDNRAFEDKTGNIFRALGFEVIMRPRVNSAETEIEILLTYNGKYCGIIDAKNYHTKFTLTAQLSSHMASEYIPNYDGYQGKRLMFFGYVTASDWGGEKNLKQITAKAKKFISDREIKGIIISAKALLGFLDYCIENNIPEEERIKMFLKIIDNKAYSSFEEILSYL